MAATVPVSVVETPEFLSAARKLMSDEERALLAEYLAYNPTAGDLCAGNRWHSEAAVGVGRAGQARRRAGDLLPSTPACRSSRSPLTQRTSGPI